MRRLPGHLAVMRLDARAEERIGLPGESLEFSECRVWVTNLGRRST
jgi:hypothetical protein